jgi:CheY-like chemotaxis protein
MNTQQGYLLVVEDIPDILNLLDATLKFKGFRVATASNGEEALKLVQQERPAMIITDILMPRMDGFSLVHRLRLNPQTRDIPVVFLSATYVAPEDKEFALSLGITRFIEKPVDMEWFVPTIADLLAKGTPVTQKPLDEFEFYDGYRKRLEIKLHQKNTQITRAEHLLRTISSEDEKHTMAASLHQLVSEREEIRHLLEEVRGQLSNHAKPASEESGEKDGAGSQE